MALPLEVSLHAGAAFPLGSVGITSVEAAHKNRIGGSGPTFGATAEWQGLTEWSAGVSIDYVSLGSRYDDSALPGSFLAYSIRSVVAAPYLRWRKNGSGVRPYVLAGMGVHRTELVFDEDYETTIAARKSGLAGLLGAGLEIPLPSNVLLGFEARGLWLSERRFESSSTAARVRQVTVGASTTIALVRLSKRF